MSHNPYKILGVDRDASNADIRSAFRELAKKFHPDRNPGDNHAEEKFKQISAAYDLLSDAAARNSIDDELERASQPRSDFPAGHASGTSRQTRSTTAAPAYAFSDIAREAWHLSKSLAAAFFSAFRRPPRLKDIWRGGETTDAAWFLGLVFFVLISSATINLFAACNPFVGAMAPNRIALMLSAPLMAASVGGALALMSKEFLVFSGVAIFFAWVGNGVGAAAFPSALYFCGLVIAGGLLMDGALRTSAGAALTGYDWEEPASPLMSSLALAAFSFSAFWFAAIRITGYAGACAVVAA